MSFMFNPHPFDDPNAVNRPDLSKGVLDSIITGTKESAHHLSDIVINKLDRENCTWTRNVIDEATKVGGGMQICVADMSGNGKLDIVAPGKGGLYLFKSV